METHLSVMYGLCVFRRGRKTMKKIFAIILCACMICALLVGCGSSESPAAAVEGDVLKIGIFEPATGENGAGGMQEVLGARYANKVDRKRVV